MSTITPKLAGVALVGLWAVPTMADLTVRFTDYTTTFRDYRVGSFGVQRQAVLADWDTAGVTSDFRTFCVGKGTLVLGRTYEAVIDETIKNDRVEHALSPISKSAYAYYRAGDFTIGVDSASKNRALQALFWDLEGVLTTGGYSGAGYQRDSYAALSATEQRYYDTYYTEAGTLHADAGSVKVVNLWDVGNAYDQLYDRQSHLVAMVMTPAPDAALLGVIGLGALARVRRRIA